MPPKQRKQKSDTRKAPQKEKQKEESPIILRVCALLLTVIQCLMAIVITLMFSLYMFYGGGTSFPQQNIIEDPIYDLSSLETIANLPFPPGNIAVSESGRVFITLHPEGHPPAQVCELKNGNTLAYPSIEFQEDLASVLAVRIAPDANGNELLWVLDFGFNAVRTPKLIAIDISSGNEVHRYEFPSEVAPFLSMLNDFQIDPEKQVIYIADAGIFRKEGAIVIYDIESKTSRRVLAGHPSVTAKKYKTVVNSTDFTREMVVLGVFTIRPNVDSIALSRDGKWLYYASVNDDLLYKIFTLDLLDTTLSDEELGNRVREFTNKTQSDGMTTDSEGNIYYGDMENSAILRVNTKFSTPFTETLFQDDKIRWPDGFSFGPDGYLYFTCSALQHVIFKPSSYIQEMGPYQVYRFKPGFSGTPGQ